MAAFGTPAAQANPVTQTFRDGGNPEKLNGVWRSRGYGWLLAVEGGKARFYDESTNLCIEDASGADDLDDLSEGFQISADGRSMRLPLGDESYFYTFDRLDRLPEKCRRTPDAGPNSVLNSLIDIFSRHYAFFTTRNINWPTVVESTVKSSKANMSSSELLGAVRSLISQFDDDHVSVEAKIDDETVVLNTGAGKTLRALAARAEREKADPREFTARWLDGVWRNDMGKTLLGGKGRTAANGKVMFGLLEGGIGYLAIRSMEDFVSNETDDEHEDLTAVDKTMDEALAMFGGAKAVIVDVSVNDGGFDRVARLIAGRFASERTLGYYKYAGDSGADRPQPLHVVPSAGRRYTGPVYLLTSDITVSAAEIFAMSMRALPNVMHVGGTTRGALSDMLWKPLPNGWTVSLSNEVYLDAEGKAWEGKGIPPEVPLEVFSVQVAGTGHPKAVHAVIEMARDNGTLTAARP